MSLTEGRIALCEGEDVGIIVGNEVVGMADLIAVGLGERIFVGPTD